MNEMPALLCALVAGGVLGAIFFAGLWWTVRRGLASTQPALWFAGSLLLRTSLVLTGFYFLSGGRWERLLPALLGFAMARPVVMRLTRPADARHRRTAPETSHAPEPR